MLGFGALGHERRGDTHFNFVRTRDYEAAPYRFRVIPVPPSTVRATLRVGDSERPVGFNTAIRIAPECRVLAAAGFAAPLLSFTRAGQVGPLSQE